MYRMFDPTFNEAQTIKDIMQAFSNESITDDMVYKLQERVNKLPFINKLRLQAHIVIY